MGTYIMSLFLFTNQPLQLKEKMINKRQTYEKGTGQEIKGVREEVGCRDMPRILSYDRCQLYLDLYFLFLGKCHSFENMQEPS